MTIRPFGRGIRTYELLMVVTMLFGILIVWMAFKDSQAFEANETRLVSMCLKSGATAYQCESESASRRASKRIADAIETSTAVRR